MDPQQLLATLIQLSDEQQQRIAELLNRLEQQTRTLTTASQRAAQAANALDHNGQKTALHLQAAVQQSVETTLHDTLTTLSQRAEWAFCWIAFALHFGNVIKIKNLSFFNQMEKL